MTVCCMCVGCGLYRFEGSEHFMGFRDHDTGEFIDPEAVRFRSNRLRDESAILKELRLRREEDTAMAKAPGAKGGGGKQ